MTLEDLRGRRTEILKASTRHGGYNVRVFGSVARGESRPDSEVDFLIDLASERSLLDRARLIRELEGLLGKRVHAVSSRALHPLVRDRILGEAVPL